MTMSSATETLIKLHQDAIWIADEYGANPPIGVLKSIDRPTRLDPAVHQDMRRCLDIRHGE
jgi:hypothetical protein